MSCQTYKTTEGLNWEIRVFQSERLKKKKEIWHFLSLFQESIRKHFEWDIKQTGRQTTSSLSQIKCFSKYPMQNEWADRLCARYDAFVAESNVCFFPVFYPEIIAPSSYRLLAQITVTDVQPTSKRAAIMVTSCIRPGVLSSCLAAIDGCWCLNPV